MLIGGAVLLADLSPASDCTMIQRGSAVGGCAHPHRHGFSGWEKHRKTEGGWDCKWPLLLEFSPLPSVCVCACLCVCQCVCVRECQGGGDVFITASSSFCFHRGNQAARSVLLPAGNKRKRTAVCFSTVDLIFTHNIYMYGGTHEKQRERAGEWVVEWLNIRMYQSGRLL